MFDWLDIPLGWQLDFGFALASIDNVADLMEYIGLLVSFVYLILEFRQKNAMWVLSMLLSTIYICIYIHHKLYADMSFSCFNIGMCVWGLYRWKTSDKAAPETRHDITYRRFTLREWGEVAAVTVGVYALIYLLLRFLTDSPVPARDAFNTTFNIIGTWVLGRKVIEVWGFWFVANVASVYLYIVRDFTWTTIALYGFYTLASVYGYWKWRHYGRNLDEMPAPEGKTARQGKDKAIG